MPVFYFHLRNLSGLDKDQIGAEFANIEEAYLDAFDAIGTMTVELTRRKFNPRQYRFEIMDEAGGLLLELPFAEYLDQGRLPTRPPTSFQLRQAATKLRACQETAENALARCCSLQAAIQEQGVVLQDSLAETKRLLAEVQRLSGALRPLRCVGSKV